MLYTKKLLSSSLILMFASSVAYAQFGNHISGDGIPNPNPVVTQAWGDCRRAAIGGPQPALISTPLMGISGLMSAVAQVHLVVVLP